MGWKYEVSTWAKREDGYKRNDDYDYIPKYYGDSLIVALWTLFRLKRQGHGCVKLEWR